MLEHLYILVFKNPSLFTVNRCDSTFILPVCKGPEGHPNEGSL